MLGPVRLASPEDLPELAALFDLYRRFYGEPADLGLARGFLEQRLRRADSTIVVAQGLDRALIGFAQMYPTLCSVSAAPIGILYDLFVIEAERGQGVGRALLELVRSSAEQAGAVRLELATATTNHAAQNLYEALGWMRDRSFYRYSLRLR